jgi:hypothetical protein
MKKRLVQRLVITVIFFSILSLGFLVGEDIETRIVKTSQQLFGPSASPENLVDSLIEFLDITLSLTASSKHRDEIKHHVDIAKELIREKSIFNEKARQYLSFAYRMVSNGVKFQAPPELDEFVTPAEAQEKALKYCKKLVADARARVREGEPIEAAKLILKLVLMVITPVSG